MNKKMDIERPELHPIPVKAPWHHLGMDFVGPISPPAQSGNRYVLTISDYFTKFGWAVVEAGIQIMCDHCGIWYHIACIGMAKDSPLLNDSNAWLCSYCK